MARLPLTQGESVGVQQELRLVEELGRELLDVRAVMQAALPGLGDRVEQPVGMVEAVALRTVNSGLSRAALCGSCTAPIALARESLE